MNQEEINKDADGVVFESGGSDSASLSSGFVSRGQKNDFRGFVRPLFQKLPPREAVYWLIFSSASLFCTGMILVFINSFIEETERYQAELTSVGRYRALRGGAEENIADSSMAQKKENAVIGGD
ncbi:MAG: hypothetical protein WC878_04420 [Candidatus Paceibacterota bacterium]|jgi:hypothetical protein